jgi:hypothetical protein
MKQSGTDHLSETEGHQEEIVPVKAKCGNADEETHDTSHEDSHSDGDWKRDVEVEVSNGSRIGSDGDKPSLAE